MLCSFVGNVVDASCCFPSRHQVLKGTDEGAVAIDTVNSNVMADEALEERNRLLVRFLNSQGWQVML